MKLILKQQFPRVLALVLVGLTVAGLAWANGEDFFVPQEKEQTYFYYFGHIKDKNGKVLDNVIIHINVKDSPVKLAVRNDTPGHFRTPDVGMAIMGFTGDPNAPVTIEITATKDGYKQVSPSVTLAPKSKLTAREIEFVMAPVTATK